MFGTKRMFSHTAKRSLSSTIFLSRIPIVTPELTKFEQLYYKYQDELSQRLMWTFPYYFYFKKSSVAEREYLAKQKYPVSKHPGVYYNRGAPDVRHLRERKEKQVINIEEEDNENTKIKINPRVTPADEKGDLKSLERSLANTLYLVVKSAKTQQWILPKFGLEQEQAQENVTLFDNAETKLQAMSAKDMNIFRVTEKPVHVLQGQSAAAKEYIVKGHLVAGSFQLSDKKEYDDYLWLTKEELGQYLTKEYLSSIEFLLADY